MPKYLAESYRKICEDCKSPVAFSFRGQNLCAICVNRKLQAKYAEYQLQAEVERSERREFYDRLEQNPHLPWSPECEICTKSAITRVELSDLCQPCADTIMTCLHNTRVIIDFYHYLKNDYSGTCYQCVECGLRFTGPDDPTEDTEDDLD